MTLKLSDFQEGEVQEVERPKKGLAAGAGTFAKGVPVGVAKSFVGETGLGAGQIGRGIQRGISKAGEAVFGRFNPFRMGGESMFDPEQAQRIRETTLAANAPGQGTGKFIGTALQFLAPTSRITQGQQILGAAARQVPTRVGRTVAGAAARFLPEAAGTGAVAAVRSGGDLEQAKQEGITAGAFSVGLGALGGLARATYWPTLEDSVSKALGSQGKRSGGAALRQTAEKVTGLKVLKDRAADLTVTLDDGSKAAFNPDNASYSTTLQAWNEAKNKIFDEYTSLSTKAGEKATLNLADVRQQIANALEAPLVDKEINAVRSVLADFDRIFKDPNSVDMKTAERFVKSLNENMAEGFFKGTAEGASSKVYAGTSKLIREKLDEIITESEGPGYQALRSQYAALKSIEDDLVRKFQQDARSIGGGLPEYTGAFASGDIIGSALSLDPAQFAKGATLGTFAVLKRRLSNPERFLRRSFDLIDDVPSDLNLRIWGGSRPLSAAEQKAAGDVAESVSNPAVGMSIRKSVTPESVARNADREDIRLLARVVDDVSLAKTDPDVRRVLSDMGLSRATDDELVRFAKDVIDESEGVGSRTVNQSFNQGATPSTNLLEEAKKYKSAEEFVESINNKGDDSFVTPTVGLKTKTGESQLIRGFHGTNKEFDKFTIPEKGVRYTGDGVYFSPDKIGASGYGNRVVESYLDLKNPYVLRLPEGNIDFQPGNERIREIIANGHDSIIVRTGKGEDDIINEIVVFDLDAIKTKEEIVNLWKNTLSD